ncbi:MAG: valine--tRNA ligase [Candidatus Nanoarchaeia archaeon]|nr:valine--tRNA ligase [Candidatus Nanoarchaeia archaeon]
MIEQKRWDVSFEEEIIDEWHRKKLYEFDKNSKKKVFSIDTPPPYINAPIHMGHAYTFCQMDMIARHKRMKGYEVLFPLGLDCNGLPIELQAEKKYNINIREVGREFFINKCKEMLDEASNVSSSGLKRMGISFNSFEESKKVGAKYLTDSDFYRSITQKTFKQIWDMGLVYEDDKPTNYCPVCQTTIANSEIDYKEGKAFLNDLIFKIKETKKEIIISTTRPELLSSCRAVIYNPLDKRYDSLKGMHAIVPIFNKEVKIIPHKSADMDFGSGLVMVCSFGDTSDIRLFIELGLAPIYSIDKFGKMTDKAGKYAGLKVKEARAKIIEDLKDAKLLKSQKEIVHKYPICDRSKTPVEFIALKEYYVKQLEFVEHIRKISDKMEFFSKENKQLLIDWFGSISIDWPVSRTRYYATEIPIWSCKKCGYKYVNDTGKYLRPWIDPCPLKKCPECKSNDWLGETRIFDTWFDSSISNMFILGYEYDNGFFSKNYPCNLRPQGKEIVRTWLYYTLLRNYQLTKKPAFKHVWIHKHVVDDKGYKMSKSKGNGIDPMDLVKEFGSENIRIWSVLEGDITKGDIRCSPERIKGTSNFNSKLWNIARFISGFKKAKKPAKLSPSDKWIMHELNSVIKKADKLYDSYDFNSGIKIIREFMFNSYASNYLEMVKKRAYSNDSSALYTIYESFEKLILLLAPIIPIVSEKIYKELFGKKTSIHLSPFPTAGDYELSKFTKKILEFNSKVWAQKKEENKSLKDLIKIRIPKDLEIFSKDLKIMHNIE